MGNTQTKSSAGIMLTGSSLLVIGGIMAFVGFNAYAYSMDTIFPEPNVGALVSGIVGVVLALAGFVFLMLTLFRKVDA